MEEAHKEKHMAKKGGMGCVAPVALLAIHYALKHLGSNVVWRPNQGTNLQCIETNETPVCVMEELREMVCS